MCKLPPCVVHGNAQDQYYHSENVFSEIAMLLFAHDKHLFVMAPVNIAVPYDLIFKPLNDNISIYT